MGDRRKHDSDIDRTGDRRQHEREEVRNTIEISRPGGDMNSPLSVNNVSLGGLSFRSEEAWPEDGVVHIRVNADRPLELKGKILWCTERRQRFNLSWVFGRRQSYEVGVAFEERDPARCQDIVEQIFRSDAYHRGLTV